MSYYSYHISGAEMIRFRPAVVIACLLLFPFGTSIVSTPYFNNQTLRLSNDTISGVYIEDHTQLKDDQTEKTYLQSELGVFNNSYNDSGYIQIGNFGNKSNLIVRAKNYSHFQNMRCENSDNPIGEPNPDYVYTCNTVEQACICKQAAQQGYIGLSPLDIKDATYTTLTLKDSTTTNPTKTIMLNFETQPHIQINAFNQYDNNTKSATLNIKAGSPKQIFFPRHEGASTGEKFASCLHSNGANLEIQDSKLINACTDQASNPALLISEGALQFDSINAIFGKIISSNSLIDDNLNGHYVRLHFGLVSTTATNSDITVSFHHKLDPTQTETHHYAKGNNRPDITGHLNILSFTASANTTASPFQANADMIGSGISKTNIIIDIPGEILVCNQTEANGDTVTKTCE